MRFKVFFCCFLFGLSFEINAVEFDDPIILSSSDQSLSFCQTTSKILAVDSMGQAHVTYFINDDVSSPLQNQILYVSINNGISTEPIRVDSGEQGGGKHPSLAIDQNDTIHVVWSDYRHTTSTGRYMDNTEIYYDRKTIGSSFLDDDIRITETHADHLGDNGYVPKLAVGDNNQIHIVWYDFTENGNNAQVYYRKSDLEGNFQLIAGIDEFKITSIQSDPDDQASHWFPDLCRFPMNSLYVVWGYLDGWQGGFQLQGIKIQSDGQLGEIETIAENRSSFSDPPRLESDQEGNLGLVAVERSDGLNHIRFHYKPVGQNWLDSVQIDEGLYSSEQPSIAFDLSGIAHLVWQEDLGGVYQVVYASYDPVTAIVSNRTILSSSIEDARTPSIAVDLVRNEIHAAWLDRGFEGIRSILYRRQKSVNIVNWQIHQ
jgi:hypothetical protein